MTPLERARYWVNRCGFSVIPVGLNKKPITDSWLEFQQRKPTDEELQEWAKKPNVQWAVVTGKVSGLTVVDADSLQAVEVIENRIPALGLVPTTLTPSGGKHFWGAYTPELPQFQITKLRPNIKPGERIDVRNDGGYALLPGAKAYLKDPSDKLINKIGPYRFGKWPRDNGKSAADFILERPQFNPELIKHILEVVMRKVAGPTPKAAAPAGNKIKQGQRDDELFHKALGMVRSNIPRELVEESILKLAREYCDPPFPENEALRKVQAAYDYHERKERASQPTFTKNFGNPCELKTNIRELSTFPKVPLEWLWPGRFALGMLGVIAGRQGDGKSTFGEWMACRLARGDDWPDGPGFGRPVASLIITSEDPVEQIIKYRIEAMGGDDRLIYIMDTVLDGEQEFPFDLTIHLPQLEQDLKNNVNIKFVLIDPLASHMGGNLDAGDMNRVRWHLAPLAKLAKRYNISIIGIVHFKKDENVTEVLNMIAGSYQFTSLPRAAWLIMRDKNAPASDNRRYFLPGKINPCQPRGGLSFTIQNVIIDGQDVGKIVFDKETSQYTTANELNIKNLGLRATKAEGIEELITGFLADGPRLSSELNNALELAGYNLRTADRVKTELRNKGIIRFAKEPEVENGPWWILLNAKPGRFGGEA